ncbi:glycosyltransferase [Gordonia jinghuaiqii]|uniref:4,4'-diaponeurosporenoate glycosyltransferase n=1 Tax=Gordonia jinghuaiqii TaxID=2758710 RepID=A0A7D7LSX8_9ACTN|nr:glycosyltransferase family 2 protein [Gordonia jinghuaiqii]MCR5979477.1 glycosyltransferase [Gordonia jinghuaiqii]QMT00721.1 glycosyltransferase family 2 protein [Gordonia jinghuaiqii]
MKLSAVVPAYNEEAAIGACLDRLLAQTRPFDEIVVVDNASTDGTRGVLDSYAERNPIIRVVVEPTPGIYHARRAGFDAATGDVLARTDADTLVCPTWAAAIESHFAGPRGEQFSAVTGPGLFGEAPPFDPIRKLAERGKLFKEGGETQGLVGPNMVMASKVWDDIRDELIDDDEIWEDLDVSLTLAGLGHRIWFDPGLVVESSPRQVRHSAWKNRSYLLGGLKTAVRRGDNKLRWALRMDLPFRFVLYSILWLTHRPWDSATQTWRPHRLFTPLERERPLITNGR